MKKYFQICSTVLFVVFIQPLYGISYQSWTESSFTTVHLLLVDPQENEIVAVRAEGGAILRETTLAMALREGAVAGINGGYWKDSGKPAGVLRIGGKWHGLSQKFRAAIGWSDGGKDVEVDRVKIFSSEEVTKGWHRFQYIVGGAGLLVKGGEVVKDQMAEEIQASFERKKHSRTAVGVKGDGQWVFVVVDGQRFGLFGGMTLLELSQLMIELGCEEAVNLDGGGSSTMVVNSTVVNTPMGDFFEEGKLVELVSDAILILPKVPNYLGVHFQEIFFDTSKRR